MLVIIIIVIIYCQAQGDEVTAMQQPLSLSIMCEEGILVLELLPEKIDWSHIFI